MQLKPSDHAASKVEANDSMIYPEPTSLSVELMCVPVKSNHCERTAKWALRHQQAIPPCSLLPRAKTNHIVAGNPSCVVTRSTSATRVSTKRLISGSPRVLTACVFASKSSVHPKKKSVHTHCHVESSHYAIFPTPRIQEMLRCGLRY